MEDAAGAYTANVDNLFKLTVTEGVNVRSAIVAQSWRTVSLQQRFARKLELLRIAFKVEERVPATVAIDQGRMSLVLINMLSFAVDRADAGADESKAAAAVVIEADYHCSSRSLEFAVRYTGKALSKEEMRVLYPRPQRRRSSDRGASAGRRCFWRRGAVY